MAIREAISPHQRGIEAAALLEDGRVNRRVIEQCGGRRSKATLGHWRGVARRMIDAYLAVVDEASKVGTPSNEPTLPSKTWPRGMGLPSPEEDTDHPCNVCGRGWPYHENVCVYSGNALDLQEARAEVERLRAIWPEAHARIQTLRGECSDELPHQMLDQALAKLDDVLYAMTHPAESSDANG
jgi:hypothetical protein